MKPAILGGEPAFVRPLPFACPTLPPFEAVSANAAETFRTGTVTKGHFLREYEEATAAYLGVGEAVGLSSCTAGLILLVQALGLTGEVIVPSFTFAATVLGLSWNAVRPVFADCDPDTFELDPGDVLARITPRTSGIMATYIFGNTPPFKELASLAEKKSLALIYDAAHGCGTLHDGKPVGSRGAAEVFSTSATKLLATGEGGLLATNDPHLAEKIRVAREYGNSGNYLFTMTGLNARLPEFGAILGLSGLPLLRGHALSRNRLARLYMDRLGILPGIRFQKIAENTVSSYKDFSILVSEEEFGLSRDELESSLEAEGIPVRKYYFPPVHRQPAYEAFLSPKDGELPNTDKVSSGILSLPMFSHMEDWQVERTAAAVERIHRNADEIARKLRG
jgi:dTDP-4-amino-4,6-dideoxygalactose transaminase